MPSYGFLSSYPPTQCGLATFCSALMRNVVPPGSDDRAGVVRVLDAPGPVSAPEVVASLYTGSPVGHVAAADALNTFDLAVIQHEYGIYGGADGDQLLAVLDRLSVPSVVVAHTVLDRPTLHQSVVLRQVVSSTQAVVTMTEAARERLIRRYDADPAKVHVIKHGARIQGSYEVPVAGRRPVILTWGLLGPGKGIERAIDGLRRLQLLRPLPLYVVAGQTHPRVRLHEGEAYRVRLGQRARAMGVSNMLRFERSYLDDDVLSRLIGRADVVVLPYDSREQVTSGVLVEAVASGKPVVATMFPHAVELLSGGAGILVPQFDGPAIGKALHSILTDPAKARRMAAEAEALAPTLLWPAVADLYRSLMTGLLASRAPVSG